MCGSCTSAWGSRLQVTAQVNEQSFAETIGGEDKEIRSNEWTDEDAGYRSSTDRGSQAPAKDSWSPVSKDVSAGLEVKPVWDQPEATNKRQKWADPENATVQCAVREAHPQPHQDKQWGYH